MIKSNWWIQSVNRLVGRARSGKSPQAWSAGCKQKSGLLAVVPNRFDGAAFHGFLALRFFVGRGRLFEDERISAIIITREIARSRLAAQVTINALIVNVESSRNTFRIFICDISHILLLLYVSLSGRFKRGFQNNA